LYLAGHLSLLLGLNGNAASRLFNFLFNDLDAESGEDYIIADVILDTCAVAPVVVEKVGVKNNFRHRSILLIENGGGD
jgi:hypothetical protein